MWHQLNAAAACYYVYFLWSHFTIDILKFDNSYSWAHSKEVFYTVELLPPGVKPHLHVPPGEMEKAGSGGHTPHSSPSSTHSSEFYDCDGNGTEQVNGEQLNGEQQVDSSVDIDDDGVSEACGTNS